MLERDQMTEAPATLDGDDSTDPALGPPETMDQRVHRLEEAVAALQDTNLMEDRLVDRVVERMADKPQPPRGEAASMIIDAERHLLPAALHSSADGKAGAEPPSAPPTWAQRWLLTDLYTELRTMIDMYLDRRYRSRLTWMGKVLPPALLAAIATSWIWLPGTALLPSFISILMVKTVDIVLAFFLYKVLNREVTRYREAVLPGSRRS